MTQLRECSTRWINNVINVIFRTLLCRSYDQKSYPRIWPFVRPGMSCPRKWHSRGIDFLVHRCAPKGPVSFVLTQNLRNAGMPGVGARSHSSRTHSNVKIFLCLVYFLIVIFCFSLFISFLWKYYKYCSVLFYCSNLFLLMMWFTNEHVVWMATYNHLFCQSQVWI